MTELIKELRAEHAEILNYLSKAKSLGIRSERGCEKILAARDVLLNHIEKEDKRLYPILNRAAENNEKLKNTLVKYADDMDKVSRFAMGFFEKYSHMDLADNIADDFKQLFNILMERVVKEEKVLFKTYMQIIGSKRD